MLRLRSLFVPIHRRQYEHKITFVFRLLLFCLGFSSLVNVHLLLHFTQQWEVSVDKEVKEADDGFFFGTLLTSNPSDSTASGIFH